VTPSQLVARKDLDLFDAPLGGGGGVGGLISSGGFKVNTDAYDFAGSGGGAEEASYSPLAGGGGLAGDTGHKLYKPFDRKRKGDNAWV